VTTNEAQRTDDRVPTGDASAPEESRSDESLPDRESDEIEVDEAQTDEPEMEPAPAEVDEAQTDEPEMEPAPAEVDDTAEPEPLDIGPRTDAAGTGGVASAGDEPLVADATSYQDRWYEIQTGFVDEPSRAVQSAGELLTELIDDLNRRLTSELEALDAGRGAGDDTSTEDLRVTFQRYRSFFDRLMTT
jgi:hypothetical protein